MADGSQFLDEITTELAGDTLQTSNSSPVKEAASPDCFFRHRTAPNVITVYTIQFVAASANLKSAVEALLGHISPQATQR